MLHTFDDVQGYETAKELAEATVKTLHTAIININKMFINNTASTRTSFPLTPITKMKALCVYLKRYIIINETRDIRLITSSNIQEMVLCFDSWIVEADDTDNIVKQKELNFDTKRLKYLEMTSKLSFVQQEDSVELS